MFSCQVQSNSLGLHGLQHTRLICPPLSSNSMVILSNHLILCHPHLLLLSIFASIRVFFNDLALCIRWAKYWSFSFNVSPSNDYSGMISFRIDWFDLIAVQETLKSLLQYHNSKALSFFMVQLSHLYMTTGKNHSFDYTDLCQQSDAFAF